MSQSTQPKVFVPREKFDPNTINKNYHLPDGSYWCSNKNYNSISRVERISSGNTIASNAQFRVLKNKKITNRIKGLLSFMQPEGDFSDQEMLFV